MFRLCASRTAGGSALRGWRFRAWTTRPYQRNREQGCGFLRPERRAKHPSCCTPARLPMRFHSKPPSCNHHGRMLSPLPILTLHGAYSPLHMERGSGGEVAVSVFCPLRSASRPLCPAFCHSLPPPFHRKYNPLFFSQFAVRCDSGGLTLLFHPLYCFTR